MEINTLLYVKRDEAMNHLMDSLYGIGFSKDMLRGYEEIIQRSNSSQKGLDILIKS